MATSFDAYVERVRRHSTSSTCSSSSSSVATVDTSVSSRRSVGSWRSEGQESMELRSARLVWNNRSVRHIWDVDFLPDGRLLAVVGKDARMDGKVVTIYNKELRCYGPDGTPTRLPLPGKFVDPGGVAVCQTTGNVAVTDRLTPGCDTRGVVTVWNHENNNWTCQSTFKNTHSAFRLGLTEKNSPVCAVRWEKLVKFTAGERIWSKSISSSNELVPYLATDGAHIIVSTPANDRISVFDRTSAQLVSVFPTWFIKRPVGVCVDSVGRVYIADKATHYISQFSSKGHFIQRVVRTSEEPSCIRILDEKYLAVGTYFDGLYLYELDWE